MNCYGESFLAYPRTNLLEKKKKKRRQPTALFVTLPAHAPFQEIPFLLAQSIILEIRFCHIFKSSEFTMLLLPLLFFPALFYKSFLGHFLCSCLFYSIPTSFSVLYLAIMLDSLLRSLGFSVKKHFYSASLCGLEKHLLRKTMNCWCAIFLAYISRNGFAVKKI